VFSGLAHWIKGGIFFWLGILTLGRWAGCFGEWGWAWNVRPKSPAQKWRPSAEFVESFLIFFYGATNIFLEHLGGAGEAYSATDLEHVSITVLFIGGGLVRFFSFHPLIFFSLFCLPLPICGLVVVIFFFLLMPISLDLVRHARRVDTHPRPPEHDRH
jgi:hypothetical protein